MKSNHSFFEFAYKHQDDRRRLGYGGWEYIPSKSLKRVLKKAEVMMNPKERAFLDIGCGDGRHLEYLSKKGFISTGVDFSNNAIKICEKRFRGNPLIKINKLDVTRKDAFAGFPRFDLVLDWSVLDHFNYKNLHQYLRNLDKVVKIGGFIILAEFDESHPGLFKNKRYKIRNGLYSRCYSMRELKDLFKNYIVAHFEESVLEDKKSNYRFNVVLMRRIK